jgi:hypothetical protein
MTLFERDPDKRPSTQTGSMLMIVVCGYIIYLGVNILSGYVKGEGGNTPAWVQIVFGLLFVGAGAGFIIRYLILIASANAAAKEDRDSSGQA